MTHPAECKTHGIRKELNRRFTEHLITAEEWVDLMDEVVGLCTCRHVPKRNPHPHDPDWPY